MEASDIIAAAGDDVELRAIADDFSFRTRAIEGTLGAANTYYETANGRDERVPESEAAFVNQLPAKEITSERAQ